MYCNKMFYQAIYVEFKKQQQQNTPFVFRRSICPQV